MGAVEEGAVPESSAGEAEDGAVREPSAEGPSEVLSLIHISEPTRPY